MSNINIRQAVLSDIDALAPLFDSYRQFYGCTPDIYAAREFLLSRFDHDESIILIAEDGGIAVGFAQLYPSFSSVSLARIFILNDIFVYGQSRRKGVARRLLRSAVGFAKTLGAVRLSLSTMIDNDSAQSLYNSEGWKRDQKFIVYHNPLQV